MDIFCVTNKLFKKVLFYKNDFDFFLIVDCRLVIKPEYAFGEKGNEAFGIPANATIEYTVTLNEFEREPEAWKLNAEESLTQAKLIKDKATAFLKQEKYELATKLFEKANTYLSNCTCKYSELWLTTYSNDWIK